MIFEQINTRLCAQGVKSAREENRKQLKSYGTSLPLLRGYPEKLVSTWLEKSGTAKEQMIPRT